MTTQDTEFRMWSMTYSFDLAWKYVHTFYLFLIAILASAVALGQQMSWLRPPLIVVSTSSGFVSGWGRGDACLPYFLPGKEGWKALGEPRPRTHREYSSGGGFGTQHVRYAGANPTRNTIPGRSRGTDGGRSTSGDRGNSVLLVPDWDVSILSFNMIFEL